MIEIDKQHLRNTIANYRNFIDTCSFENDFKLTANSEISPYALCFAIFSYHLIGDHGYILKNKNVWVEKIITNLDDFKNQQQDLINSKPYLQLLTFSLSALKILDSLDHPCIESHVILILNYDINDLLNRAGVKKGTPSSGNMAMFWAILLIHVNKFLNISVEKDLDSWITFHLDSMNDYGFWGEAKNMNYLMFQNGYHQYEILDYLKVEGEFWDVAATNINSLKDSESRFAPYPGGGGCYDYDALYFLTSDYIDPEFEETIIKLFYSVTSSQNIDGGFCESQYVRPRTIKNFRRALNHIFSRPSGNRIEAIKKFISLQRPRHNKIHTHWTTYSREWSESDLWDSWFRVLLLARIDVYKNHENFQNWGFINYPGIGYHHLFNKEKNI
jgi:hypothetical protein